MVSVSKDIRSLSKVIAIVTGGASGLGRATVARLVRNGARVTIADLPTSKGDDVAKELGERCTFVPANVSILYDACVCVCVCVCHSSQLVAFARSEINMQTKLCSTPPLQPDGENKHSIHKMCP